MSKSKNGNGHAGSGVFGSPERVLVKRALAEFRSGRPVLFSSPSGKFHIALPVDGLDAARLRAFEHLCEPAKPKHDVCSFQSCPLSALRKGVEQGQES